ncbi:hypothetical protein A2415_02145 [candidate division WWE3 bacterium RIFOXYC1_FULL_39_7]|uniref:VIT family protein n=2 Tax=Katanobacteria TaxID=422282 RepID=A0A1F4X920_UNCKA|nr:MAG: hypothetical protein A2415_02145 [candidate division WWE3 bacterium RIFOXYC1_FULL_39_7]OGC78162.1 MAG: hypothetical protein A2619_01730 [candidate division WWE3 bacterium RIFOXYD1_FULL_39_9]
MKLKISPDYIRNLIFGAEDSLVSTVGVLFGLASSNSYSLEQMLLVGFTLTGVEALSMGVGSFLTETEVHEVDHSSRHKDLPSIDGIIMFFSYFIFGIFVLLPYVILGVGTGKYISVLITFVALYFVGYMPTRKITDGTRMFLIAGSAIVVGYVISKIFENISF